MSLLGNRITVLIAAWNNADVLSECLDSIQRYYPGVPTVLVDNGSTPPLPPYPNVTTVRSKCNLGFAGGNNLGLPYCKNEYVLLLNSDTRFNSSQTLQTLVTFLDTHPKVALAQAKLALDEHRLDACGEFLTPWGVLYHHGYQQPDGAHANHPFPVYAAKAACALFRRSSLEDIGHQLFRDDYFCYGEDLELAHRLWLAGYEVWFVPTDPVWHLEKATSAKLPSKTVWQHYLSNLLTTACDYWSWQSWKRLGAGLLLLLIGGALLKRVLPHRRKSKLSFVIRRPDTQWLPQVYVPVRPGYLLACLRRAFQNTLYPLPPRICAKRKKAQILNQTAK